MADFYSVLARTAEEPRAFSMFCVPANAPGLRTELEIRSELAWLDALRRETDLLVPEAIPTRSGRRRARGNVRSRCGPSN